MAAVSINFNTSEWDSLIANLTDELQSFVMGALVEQGSEIIEEELSAVIPVDTGYAQSTIQREVSQETAEIFTESGYIGFVDRGTKAHDIYAAPGSALVFEIDGITIFAKHVKHPGIKARHFTLQAVENAQPRIQDMVEEVLSELFSRL